MIEYFIAIIATLMLGVSLNSSVRIINESDEAIVERLGQYNRTLTSGLRIVLPIIEKIVYYDTIRERMIDIPPQEVLTEEGIKLKIDAAIYWKVDDLHKLYYDVEKVDELIADFVNNTLRAEVGQRKLFELLASIGKVDKAILAALDEVTPTWGIKVLRVSIQTIEPPKSVTDAREKEKAAESIQRAEILEAESEAKFIEVLARVMKMEPNSPEFIKFLIAKQYVTANEELSKSNNSKIIFMHPEKLTEEIVNLMEQEVPHSPSNPSPPLKLIKSNGEALNSDDNVS
ncbi:MAG: SPFH domain-containing protein [Microcoleaceae cyanobacterium]